MKSLIPVIVFILAIPELHAQSLEEKLEKVGPNYGRLYVQPLADAMGLNVNSNLFYSAAVPFESKKPAQFNIGIRLRFMNTFLKSEDQVFDYSYNDTGIVSGVPVVGTYSVTDAPTIAGDKKASVAKFTYNGIPYPDNDIELIGGIVETKYAPMFIPEITFGTVYATDASIILLPNINVGDYGSFGMFGFTIRHNLSHYVKNSPVDYSILAGYQKMSLTEKDNNDLWKSNSFFINGQLSKTFGGFFTAYAALQYENFKADVSYNYINNGDKIPVTFTVNGDTKFRGVIGGTLKTGFFAFNIDANLASRFALSLGLNFIIM